jgi:hypothetical protein
MLPQQNVLATISCINDTHIYIANAVHNSNTVGECCHVVYTRPMYMERCKQWNAPQGSRRLIIAP